MNKKIFCSIFLTSLLVILGSFVLFTGILFQFLEKQTEGELRTEMKYLVEGIENEGTAYLERVTSFGRRITLIDPDGTVVYDNQADAESMDNHSSRKEVKAAFSYGSGTSIRFSATRAEMTIYYAEKLQSGQVLRIAVTRSTVIALLLQLVGPTIIVLCVAVLLSLMISSKVSKSILEPLNNLDLDQPQNNTTYEELSPLLTRISQQNETIEKQLREAMQMREEFRLITENMSEGFLVIDKNTNLLTYNSSALRLLDITGKPEGSILKLNRTRDFRKAVTKALDGEKAEQFMEHEDRTYKLIASPVYDESGKKEIGSVIVILDMTESLKRESLRREFTANVSHELKTPLTSISGFAELLMNGGISEDTVKDFAGSIYDEAGRMIRLVNDILNLSSLDDGAVSYDWSEVDLYQLTEEILSRLLPAAEKKHVQLHLDGEHGTVQGIEQVISEMIYNVCDNAIKYNREKGHVSVHITGSAHHMTVQVEDDGIGIPVIHQNRVFERFYRVDKSRSKSVGGTGLGLSIVKHGAALHHATVHMQSREGAGTTITMCFRRENPDLIMELEDGKVHKQKTEA